MRVRCGRVRCLNTFPERGLKKYCSRRCKDRVETALRQFAAHEVESGRISQAWIEDNFDPITKGKPDG